MKTVLVAGATGYLGRHIVKHYTSLGWHVRVLVRNIKSAQASGLEATEFFEGEATNPLTLCGVMDNVDLVISTVGITRQRDGLSYRDVDYKANSNLLREALHSGVRHFTYVHVLNADRMLNVPLVAAKQAFADELKVAPIQSTIIAPSGFFSDMGDFLSMAKNGRVWLFGSGQLRLNPIDGADLAVAIANAVERKEGYMPVGGPERFTHLELAETAFSALGKKPKVTLLPDLFRRFAIRILPYVTPAHIHGPALFFLSAMGMNMIGRPSGYKRLSNHFGEVLNADRGQKDDNQKAANVMESVS